MTETHARAAAESTTLDLVRGRVAALPFADGTFDRVIAATLLCCLRETNSAIAEMARVLAPGGRLVIGARFDTWLGRRTTVGAAFIAMPATRPFDFDCDCRPAPPEIDNVG